MVLPTDSVDQLASYLETCEKIREETVAHLKGEEVDGEGFLDLNEEKLLKFFPTITYGQRRELVKIVNLFKSEEPDQHQQSVAPTQDKEEFCSVLDGYVDNDGVFQVISGKESSSVVATSYCVSASFLKKKKENVSKPEPGHRSKKKRSEDPDVAPFDIMSILNSCEAGLKVKEFIRNNKFIDYKNQVRFMKLIYDHYAADNGSPEKYYPTTNVKLSIAKGIVKDFPELADDGDSPWMSWLKIVTTKFETLQSDLPPEKRKNVKKALQLSGSTSAKSSQRTKSVAKATPEKPSQSTNTINPVSVQSSNEEEHVDDGSDKSHKRLMDDLIPTPANKAMISLALTSSYISRRKWILTTSPSCTEILKEYKHLSSYEGTMISQEFGRIECLYQGDFTIKFDRLAPYILQYARISKPAVVKEAEEKFKNDKLLAIVILPKLLVLTLNKNTTKPHLLDHIKTYKGFIEKIPSSALFQIAPEGTDVEAYVSVEAADNNSKPTPIFPFLLWLSNDYSSGKIYLKIDKKVIYLGTFSSQENNSNVMIRALEICMQAHHTFNLEYHPYLRSYYDYLEFLMGMKTPLNSVQKFVTAIRQLMS